MAVYNRQKAKDIAAIIKALPEGKGLNFFSFTGNTEQDPTSAAMYPSLNYPQTTDFFFFVCMHQYGFWLGNDVGYEQPLFGTFGGKQIKGSDALWRSVKRAMDADPEIVTPARLAKISYDDMARKLFADDNGVMPYPDLEHRFRLTRGYGKSLADIGNTPSDVVAVANDEQEPLAQFLTITSNIVGYNDDPLQKKNLLLAMALANRPEKFLDVKDPDSWTPVVDYHLQRLALRMDGVKITAKEKKILEQKEWASAKLEEDVRNATSVFWHMVQQHSGKPHGFIDEKAWMARKYCPEMEEPKCGECLFKKGCDQEKKLFQPVFRTDAY